MIHERIDTGGLIVVDQCGPSRPLWPKQPDGVTENRSSSGRGTRLHQEGHAICYDHGNDVSEAEEILWVGWQEGDLEMIKDEVEAKVRRPKW